MEERYSLVDHPASFKSRGLGQFADSVLPLIDQSISRDAPEAAVVQQIVSKYKGKKVEFLTVADKKGDFNRSTIEVIDWNEAKNRKEDIFKRFLQSPFTNEYLPFGYRLTDDGKEYLYLAETLDTPSPWVRSYGEDSSNTWVGHYYGSSLRNCAIIPFTLPEQYLNRDAFEVASELEALAQENNDASIKAAGFESLAHVNYAIERARRSVTVGIAEAQSLLDEQSKKMEAAMSENIAAAQSGGLLDPIKGISLEDWAAANVQISNGRPLAEVLKVLETEKPVWDEVSAEWMARMSQDTTFAISKVYGDAFTNPNMGRFAQAGGGAAQGSGEADKVKNDFELYIKIMCHQNMASTQGIDAASVLKQYGLSVTDWSMVGAHWAPKMGSDLTLAMKMSPLMEKYNAEFASAGTGSDISF
ncbi:DUF6620 family protein [Chitinophaga pollutisoli]|uniref:DUF6620 family protein n=1 Tax=Chitinophaga pollutisoli TaxID=3133966 RepID=A0ABZ2YSE7_9BACT